MDLAGVRVAVTGAAGFIGAALCTRLESDGAEVTGLDLAGAGRVCDVTDARAVAAALEGSELVVHTAALVTDHGSMDDFVRVNVRGTRNVLDGARAAGVRRVVHLSSVAGWGHDFRHELAEGAEPRACGVPYVDTKAASDALARARGATVVRPGDAYGPGSVPWTRRPLEALRAGRFAVPAPGDGLMALVYVDDLVDCIVRALVRPEGERGVFVAWDRRPV
ncbi:MAG: NAD-dependent epimerase/dehydratase family protein, partial [Solirubrobacteraceae bacterium]